ncbi:MAG TPA: hypothetical protein VKV15_03035 [Bryobacteraceae bacterium]|nr:hypothetical protein [Bryobacteraceae bacterium]
MTEREALILEHRVVVEKLVGVLLRHGQAPCIEKDDLYQVGYAELMNSIDRPPVGPLPLEKRIARNCKTVMLRFIQRQRRTSNCFVLNRDALPQGAGETFDNLPDLVHRRAVTGRDTRADWTFNASSTVLRERIQVAGRVHMVYQLTPVSDEAVLASASAFLQCALYHPLHERYMRAAQRNRKRIAGRLRKIN